MLSLHIIILSRNQCDANDVHLNLSLSASNKIQDSMKYFKHQWTNTYHSTSLSDA